VGATLVGFSGLFLLMSCLSGLVLWWPRNQGFKKGLLVKSGSHGIRLHYDIHRVSGMYTVVLLVVLAATGIYLTFPNYLKPVIGLTSSLQQEPNFDFLPTSHLPMINADQALHLADAFAPGNRVKCLWLPGASGATWRVSMVGEQGVGWSGGPVELWLHPEGGTVLASYKYEQGSAGDSLIAWQLPLHSGRAFGTMGRVLIFIAGLIPLIMGITGTAIWMRKRKSRIHQKTRIVISKN
jgi:uncharacterized iron-regulated membrane protein